MRHYVSPIKGRSDSQAALVVVIIQQPAETFPPMHFAFAARMLRLGTYQCIVQTLVVALAMVICSAFAMTPASVVRGVSPQHLGFRR
jgi:hypothetical protein